MKQILLISFFLFALVACQMFNDSRRLTIDIESDTTLVLQKMDGQAAIWGMNLQITGYLEDTIALSLSNGENVFDDYKLAGKIDTIFHSDWYNDTCFVRFEHVKRPVKDLRIDYEFFD